MRLPIDSPFSPGSDTVPLVWAGRTSHLSDWSDILRPRRLAGIHERGRTILGEAGSGKSSLVRRIARDAASRGDWITPQLRIPTGTDPLKAVARALLDLADRAGLASAREARIAELLNRVESVAVSGVSIAMRARSEAEPYAALRDVLIEIGRVAMHTPAMMVLIHIDEVQNITDSSALSQLLIALGDALVHEEPVEAPGGMRIIRALPLAVYLTGLPEFADMAGARSGATFARRFQVTTLRSIDDDAFLTALQPFVTQGWPITTDTGETEHIVMTPDAQRMIVELACGEPFLFQLAGQNAWYAGTDNTITAEQVRKGWRLAAGEAETHVQRILDRLPTRERQFLDAMAALAPNERTLSTISSAMGYHSPTAAGTTAQRLELARGIIDRGRLYSFTNRAVEAMLTSAWPHVEG